MPSSPMLSSLPSIDRTKSCEMSAISTIFCAEYARISVGLNSLSQFLGLRIERYSPEYENKTHNDGKERYDRTSQYYRLPLMPEIRDSCRLKPLLSLWSCASLAKQRTHP